MRGYEFGSATSTAKHGLPTRAALHRHRHHPNAPQSVPCRDVCMVSACDSCPRAGYGARAHGPKKLWYCFCLWPLSVFFFYVRIGVLCCSFCLGFFCRCRRRYRRTTCLRSSQVLAPKTPRPTPLVRQHARACAHAVSSFCQIFGVSIFVVTVFAEFFTTIEFALINL